jgi:hypothetical protein
MGPMQTQTIDAREVLCGFLETSRQFYNSDLDALPPGSATQSIGGVCRTPLDYTMECAALNHFTARAIKGEPQPPDGDGHGPANPDKTLDEAKAALNESVEALVSAIRSADEEALLKTITAPWGAEMRCLDLATVVAYNMAYHDGQLNTVQAFHGDSDIHWKM